MTIRKAEMVRTADPTMLKPAPFKMVRTADPTEAAG